MGLNFKISFDSIEGFIKINKTFKDEIKEKIISNVSINKFSKKIGITSVAIGDFLNDEKSFIRISNFIKILKLLKISTKSAEKQIIGFKDANRTTNFKIKFPYIFSPSDLRIIGVLIGDGNVRNDRVMLRWIQNDTTPLKKLLSSKIQGYHFSNRETNQLIIPSFFGKITCSLLNLKGDEIDTYKLIEKVIDYPKEYRLALLISLIEDEGNIDPKNYSGISIRMSDKKIVYFIKLLCESLGYETSKITKYKNNRYSFGEGNVMYKLKILSEGIFNLGYDLIKFEKKFGKENSLWKKRKNFFKRWEICAGKKSRKDKEGREIHQKISELFKKNKELSINEISKNLNVKRIRIEWHIKNMYKRKEIERTGRGIYISKLLR